MSRPVVQVEHVSKSFRIGRPRPAYRTLRDTLVDALAAPFRRFRGARESDEEEFWALRDVSLDVNQGEIVGIIGRNGAGKSTLLKILSRITPPTEGRVTLHGRVASLLEVGTGFHPELTGRDNIYLNGAILGMKKAEIARKFDEIVAFSEVEKFLDTPVKHYSSGMHMRLAFAVAAHLDSEIMFVDEVLAVGDAEFQRRCLGKIDEVTRSGRTVLLVSHNMAAIQKLSTRVLLLHQGQVRRVGDTASVIDDYVALMSQPATRGSTLVRLGRPPGFGEALRFSRCSLLNAANVETARLLFGEPFSIRMEADVYKDVHDLSFICGVETPMEACISTSASEDRQRLYGAAASSTLCVTARLDQMKLMPGTYYVTLSVRSGHLGLDRVARALEFTVDDAIYEGYVPYPYKWGYLHCLADWSEAPAVTAAPKPVAGDK